jgi:hypothetical protein
VFSPQPSKGSKDSTGEQQVFVGKRSIPAVGHACCSTCERSIDSGGASCQSLSLAECCGCFKDDTGRKLRRTGHPGRSSAHQQSTTLTRRQHAAWEFQHCIRHLCSHKGVSREVSIAVAIYLQNSVLEIHRYRFLYP